MATVHWASGVNGDGDARIWRSTGAARLLVINDAVMADGNVLTIAAPPATGVEALRLASAGLTALGVSDAGHGAIDPDGSRAAISWASAKSGDWTTKGDWSGGVVPGSGDDVTIGVTGPYTVTISTTDAAHSLTVNDAKATIADTGTLTLGSALAMTAGTFQLESGGAISGGTLSATGGTFAWDGGTLSGVTFDGALNLTAAGSFVDIGGAGLVAKGAGGSGNGTINVTGAESHIYFENNQTIDNATINLGGGATPSLFEQDTSGKGATLTLGVDLTLDQTGAAGTSVGLYSTNTAGDSVVNEGTINAAVSGGYFSIAPLNFTNLGTINVGNGDEVTFGRGLTTAQLGNVNASGGVLNFAGGLNNAGATLDVGPNATLLGTIEGGTIAGTIGLLTTGAVLTLTGNVSMTGAGGTGSGTINVTGIESQLVFQNTATIDNATINLGGIGVPSISEHDTTGAGATVTLGVDLTIDQTGAAGTSAGLYSTNTAGDSVVNKGTINAAVSGGYFTIAPLNFTNLGTINVSNGDELTFARGLTTEQLGNVNASGGTLNFVATLNNTGATLAVSASETLLGTIEGGTIAGTIGLLTTGADLTLTGDVSMTGVGGTGSGTINVTGVESELIFQNTSTIDNATINLGGIGVPSISEHDTTGAGATLTLGVDLTIDQTGAAGTSAGLYSTNTAGDSVVNEGTINAAVNGGYFTIAPLNFTNLGTINVSNGDELTFARGLTTEQLGNVNASGGVLNFVATLNNTGATLAVSASETLLGTIEGGTIAGTIGLLTTGADLTLTGDVSMTGVGGTGSGTINVTGVESELIFQNTSTIDNATINLGGSSVPSISEHDTSGKGATLTLGVDLTIDQTGAAGTSAGLYSTNTAGDSVVNKGTINAAVSGGYFIIAPLNFTNLGTITVSDGDTLDLQSATLTNLSGTTLTGGNLEVDAGSTLNLSTGAKIVTDDSTIILSGAGSVIQALNSKSVEVAIDSTLATIGAAGTLELLAGRNWASMLAMSNAGTLELGGGTFTATSLTNTGTISGYGAIDGALDNTGTISVAAGQTLSLQNAKLINASNPETLIVGAGGTLQLPNNFGFANLNQITVDLDGPGSEVQSLDTSNSTEVTIEAEVTSLGSTGSLGILGGRNYTTANTIANAGTIQLGGGTLTSGLLTDAAGGTLSGFGRVASVFSDAGAVTSSGGALGFTGTGDAFSTALGGTEIDFSGGTDLLQSGSSLTSSAVGVSGGAAVTFATSQSFAGKLTLAAGTTLALGANTLTLSGTGSTLAGAVTGTGGTLAFTGGTQAVGSGAFLSLSNWTLSGGDSATIDANLTYAGTFSAGAGTTLTIGAGDTLTLSGASTFAGTVAGGGTLALTGGPDAFNAGASVSVASLAISGGAAVNVNANLGDTGALAQASGTTIALGTNTLTLSGAGTSLAGAVTGTGGTLALAGGTQTIAAGASLSVSNLSLSGGAVTTLGAALAYAGDLTQGAGTTLALGANTLTLTGTGSSLAGSVTGTGTLAFAGGTQALNSGASLSVSNWSTSGGDAASVNAAIKYAKTFADGSGTTVTIASGDSLTLSGTSSFAGTISGTGTLAFSGGTDAVNAGAVFSVSNWSLTGSATATLGESLAYGGDLSQGAGTGALALGANTLTLTGSGTTLAATVSGTGGTLAFAGGTQAVGSGAALTVSSWSLSGGDAASVNEALTYGGTFTQGAGTSLALSKVLTLTGAATFAGTVSGNGGTLALAGGADAFNAGASVSVGTLSIAGGVVVTVGAAVTDSGALTQASGTTLALGANTLTLTGTGTTLAGAVTGSGGTLALTGGTVAIDTGASLSVSNLSLSGGTASVNASLTYAGAFTEGAGATLTVATTDKLTLTGADTLAGTINGAGTVKVSNATVSGLTIGGTTVLSDAGAVIQTGTLTIGDTTAKAAQLVIAVGATYTIEDDAGVDRGHAATSSLRNSGTLIATGTGVTLVAVKTVDTGSIVAEGGVLEFNKAMTGTGSMAIDAGATLELTSTAAATLSMTFAGADATLALKDPSKFAATITGFAAGDTIDLVDKKATSAVLGAGDTLVITNGKAAVATLQLTGDYSGDTFLVASDGAGGTDVTVSAALGSATPLPAAGHQFIAAMAGMGAAAGGAISGAGEVRPETFRPTLAAPRMMQTA